MREPKRLKAQVTCMYVCITQVVVRYEKREVVVEEKSGLGCSCNLRLLMLGVFVYDVWRLIFDGERLVHMPAQEEIRHTSKDEEHK